MDRDAEWTSAVEELHEVVARGESAIASSAAIKFFRLAEPFGVRLLASRRLARDDETRIDVVRTVLVESIDKIAAAESPRAYFATAVIRTAISWGRRKDNRHDSLESQHPTLRESGVDDSFAHREDWLRAKALLDALGPREKGVVAACVLGEDRDVIAATWATSRANVDQILSRFRKKLAEDTP